MTGRARGAGTAWILALMVAACVPSEAPGPGDGAADPGGEAPGDLAPPDGGDGGVDAAGDPAGEVPGIDPGPGDPGPGDAAGETPADLPGEGPADPGPGDVADLPPEIGGDVGPGDPGVDGGPGVRCRPGDVAFPAFERGCAVDGDCGLAFHQADCCGSVEVLGIRADRLAEFDAAEAECRSQWPACGCAARIPTADDGSASGDPADFAVRCEEGLCRSRAVAGCGDLERRVTEALQEVDACGPPSGCRMQELGPVCGSLSCRQVAVGIGASPARLADLEPLGTEGLLKGCPGFHCGCGYLGVPACVEGRCRLLDPGDTCEAVKARFDALVADPAALSCSGDGDCAGTTLGFDPFCTEECACAVITNGGAATGLRALADRWQALGCPVASCSCRKCMTVVRCVEGRCRGTL